MKQHELEFRAKGYPTEFIVDGCIAYKIHNNKIEKYKECESHEEAEKYRTQLANEFWGFRLS
jgi:hypothetical protein